MTKDHPIAFLYGGLTVILLLCLFDMPYGYYSFVRFAATAAFCYLAFKENQIGNNNKVILFIILAALFQPLVKVPLGRTIWNIVDVLVAAYLLYSLLKIVKEKK